MTEIKAYQALITLFNVVILLWLPFWFGWHITRIKLFKHWSSEWWLQILICFGYLLAINAEIPALWVRLIAYYTEPMQISKHIYTLSAWDRWGHCLQYGFWALFTWIISKARIPLVVMKALDDNK